MKLCSNWFVMYPINYVAPYLHVYIKISKHFTLHKKYFIKVRDKKSFWYLRRMIHVKNWIFSLNFCVKVHQWVFRSSIKGMQVVLIKFVTLCWHKSYLITFDEEMQPDQNTILAYSYHLHHVSGLKSSKQHNIFKLQYWECFLLLLYILSCHRISPIKRPFLIVSQTFVKLLSITFISIEINYLQLD